mgnify:CR=1 FL=1
MIQIERNDLAMIVYLSNQLLNKEIDYADLIKYKNYLDKALTLIQDYDKKKEIKEIGINFTQIKLF